MSFIKKYRAVIAVVLPIVILVAIRSAGLNHFKNDAKKWAAPSFSHANILTPQQISKLSGTLLTINLDKSTQIGKTGNEIQNIPPDSVLRKMNLKMILKHDGPVLLVSSEPGLSARMWMILSQMGSGEIYILDQNTDNEVLKYKFRPDSLLN
jgi:hypothetical protein